MTTQILLQLGLLVVGFVLLIKGADVFVDGASELSERFGIPQIVIGLTIVAMGTSLPEASVSLFSALKGSSGITIGNVLGSNVANVLLILGVTALIRNIPVEKPTIRYELPFLIGISVLLPIMGLFDNEVSRLEGGILIALMVVYLLYLLWRSKRYPDTLEVEAENNAPLWKMLLLIVIGIGMIAVGSDLAVDAATELAHMLGVSDRIIGLTIIALGTSLPELVTSVVAALKGKTDIAIGNIVGSNIFNILFVAGLTAVIIPVPYQSAFLMDSLVAIGAVLLLYAGLLPRKRLGRLSGTVMLLCYIAYITSLVIS